MFQLGVFLSTIAAMCVMIGIMGPWFLAVASDVFGVTILVAVGMWCWHWVEHEFAWPGWFVPKEAKEEPGRFFVRREARRREKAELLALGREILEREQEEGRRSDEADAAGSDEASTSPAPDHERP